MKIKKLSVLGMCMLMCIFMVACSHDNSRTVTAKVAKEENTNGAVEISNPFVEYESIDEAKKILGLDRIDTPDNLGKITSISIMDNVLLQIIYMKGENEICYRVSKEIQDFDGDYTEYPENNTMYVGAYELNLEGKEGKIFVAVWSQEGVNYSITSKIGISENDIFDALITTDSE